MNGVEDKVMCCFCGETVQDGKPLILQIENFGESKQTLYAHANCLKERLHQSVPFLAPDEYEGE